MSKSFSIQDLTNFFNLQYDELQNHLQQFTGQNKNLVHQQNEEYFVTEVGFEHLQKSLEESIQITDHNLLEFIICKKIEEFSLSKDNNFIFQYTKRTKLEQQRDYKKLENLPTTVQNKYSDFGEKILTWLQSEYVSSKLTKLIIDRLPEIKPQDNQINLRITLYKGNHPSDINLKITNNTTSLQQIDTQQLKDNLKMIPELNHYLKNSEIKINHELLLNLQQILNKIKRKRTVQQMFKWLVGLNPYYLIIPEPETVIADFTKLELPTSLKVTYQQEKLIANFNNNCNLVAKIISNDNQPQLIIDFQNLPNQINLLSF
ncbi:hypothetical protein Halha_0316 [Halobacteroides halobius DSM 5150]|uniref:Uncharacterized protein n=1 Tax=Halobacteroides halobius (strain ATCC 35273 / DSM 5150 / MD-1) TaxID=748449 RepID=L0K725_HALHC|nr:hypothetical protein [Halobacteroides halobius]AGB40325.1 hypothetical protein Halha_0316 [Halobacteroides halobius DSM 5150]